MALYQLITAAAGGTTTTVLDLIPDAVNANQNNIAIDLDLTLGNVTLNLPSITNMLYATAADGAHVGGGATSFQLSATITAGGPPRTVTLHADATEGAADLICGDATVTLAGVYTTFRIYIAGRHMWGLQICTPATQS